ncbi:ABC transporter substrate-binding protein [Crocosphaera sp. XPORK-15E]|uniref:ABC transporter substrate-binding protein n=1 Tax=Crocosphaera sp. XPORK-15E TaxID=3110247 RepID=UPI002B213857|nr:ABC transporter substrate-binding protein [Crocosphaera sp. XPORK-15E]MEA5536707.1 ABC transporter substrate-binding protein [Crocosphaera sp. XPORK-15E]
MFRRLLLFLLLPFFSLLIIACNSSSTINNQPKNDVTYANRIITLTSLSSDIIEQLDKSKLVGMVGSRLFENDPRFEDIPQVSQGQTPPSLEKIIALKPDLVIGAKGFSDNTLNKLEELGIKTLSTEINSWNDMLEMTQTLATIIQADVTPLLKRYQTFLADIPKQDISSLVLVSRQPILAPNKNSWAGNLLTKFNLNNITANLQGQSPVRGYITLSAEKILQENPDILLIVDPSQQELMDEFKAEPFWKNLKATKTNKVYSFDYYGLVNPGSIDKIEEACQKLKQILNA